MHLLREENDEDEIAHKMGKMLSLSAENSFELYNILKNRKLTIFRCLEIRMKTISTVHDANL